MYAEHFVTKKVFKDMIERVVMTTLQKKKYF